MKKKNSFIEAKKNKFFYCRARGEYYLTPLPLRATPVGLDPPPFSAFGSAVSTISSRKIREVERSGHPMILRMRSTLTDSIIHIITLHVVATWRRKRI